MKIRALGASATLAVLLISLGGCATWPPAPVEYSVTLTEPAAQLIVTTGTLPGRRYSVIGPIEATVQKESIREKDPTRAQVNQLLADKARQLGADAVISVKYTAGANLSSWGYLEAKGMAVKLTP
ncbi:MAG: hypothetical protein AB9M60_01145 [Leptothrix sp. (in: b-proteobacteria)]